MRKIYFMMALLAAFCYTNIAFAGTKNLYKEDFESLKTSGLADAGWISPSLQSGLAVQGDEYGNYLVFNLGSNNGRSFYKTWGAGIFDGQLVDGTYHVELEWTFAANGTNQYSSELALFSGEKPSANNGQICDNAATLFSLSQVDADMNFKINGDAAETILLQAPQTMVIKVDVDVNQRTLSYEICDALGIDTKASGIRQFEEGTDMLISGLNVLSSRYWSVQQLDNIKVQVITDYDIANVPTVALTGVNGKERTYNITFGEEEELHVKGTDGSETIVSYYDNFGSYDYVTSTSGTLEAWTTSGTATSEHVSTVVECTEISLPAATVSIYDAQAGYAKTYTLSVTNIDVPTQPQLYLSYKFVNENGEVEAQGEDKFSGEQVTVQSKGILTVTTMAPGFTSTTTQIANDVAYKLKHDIDFQHLTADDLTAKGFEALDPLDSETTSGESNWTARQRLYYQIATGETDEEGNPVYTKYLVYGPSSQGGEPIQRYRFLQSKLTKDVAYSMFAPLYTWYYNDGITPTSCDADGNPLECDAEQPKNSGTIVHTIGGSVNVQVKVGIGLVHSGVQGDAENYDPAGAGYGNIRVNNVTMGVDGLTDDDVIVVSKITDYGSTSVHPQFPVGTDPEAAKAEYKAMNLGGVKEVLSGTQTFQLNRVDAALTRVQVFAPTTSGIEEIPYNKIVSDHNAPIYNLNGVQVNAKNLKAGVYVKQGKKFVVSK